MTYPTRISPADALEISHVKARYCRYVDTKQWAKIKGLFVSNAKFDGFAAAPNGATVDTFVEGVSKRLDGSITVHRCAMPDMVLTSANTARVIWSMTDYNEWPNQIAFPGTDGAFGFRGYGYYEEEYMRLGDTWLISYMRLVRLRVDPILPGETRGIANSKAAAGWIDPDADWVDAHRSNQAAPG